MTGATHYIEHFKHVETGREYWSLILSIRQLGTNLKHTSYPLKTIAVWKIKFHPINDIPDTVG